jgi:GTPase
MQTYNLAKATGVEVIDRFQLILEIFRSRATTTEAQMQIQLATLQNELKHAREKVRLSKGSEQPGFMGLGAYEADVYRDAIKLQVQTIQKETRSNSGKKSFTTRKPHRVRFSDGFACRDILALAKAPSSTP